MNLKIAYVLAIGLLFDELNSFSCTFHMQQSYQIKLGSKNKVNNG